MSKTKLPKTKWEQILDIVYWEHRYGYGGLKGGEWCLRRVAELMKAMSSQAAECAWIKQFGKNDDE